MIYHHISSYIIIYHHISSYIIIYHHILLSYINIYQKKPRVYCSLWPNWTIYVQNGSQHPYFPACVHMDILPQNRHIASFIGHVRHANSPFSSPAIEIPLGIYTGYNSFHRRTPLRQPFSFAGENEQYTLDFF